MSLESRLNAFAQEVGQRVGVLERKLTNVAYVADNKSASVSGTFYEDDYVVFAWDSVNQQPTYLAKSTSPVLWLWQDAGLQFTGGNSAGPPDGSNDDISSASDQVRYFSTGGALNAAFNHSNWGSFGMYHLMKESFADNFPGYNFSIHRGNSGHFRFVVEITNPDTTNYADYL